MIINEQENKILFFTIRVKYFGTVVSFTKSIISSVTWTWFYANYIFYLSFGCKFVFAQKRQATSKTVCAYLWVGWLDYYHWSVNQMSFERGI